MMPLTQRVLLQQQQQNSLAVLAAFFEGGGANNASEGGKPSGDDASRLLREGPPLRLSASERAAGRTCWTALRTALSSRAAAAAAPAEQQPLTLAITVTLQCLEKAMEELQHQNEQERGGEEEVAEKGPFRGPSLYVVGMAVVLEALLAAGAKAQLLPQAGEQQQQFLRQLLHLLQAATVAPAAPERAFLSLVQSLRLCMGIESRKEGAVRTVPNGRCGLVAGISRGCFEVLLRVAAEVPHVSAQAAARRLLLHALSRLCEELQQGETAASATASSMQRFVAALAEIVNKASDPTAVSAALKAAKRLVLQAQVTNVPLYSAIIPLIMSLLHYRHKTRWPEAFELCTEALTALECASFVDFLGCSVADAKPSCLSLRAVGSMKGLEAFREAYLSYHYPIFLPLISAIWSLLLAAEGIALRQLEEAAAMGGGSDASRKNAAFLKAKQQEIRFYKFVQYLPLPPFAKKSSEVSATMDGAPLGPFPAQGKSGCMLCDMLWVAIYRALRHTPSSPDTLLHIQAHGVEVGYCCIRFLSLRPQLEVAFGTAVRVFGCMRLLGDGQEGTRLHLSLAANASVSFEAFVTRSNVWMLPLLQRFVCRDSLQYFCRHILPAVSCYKSAEVEKEAAFFPRGQLWCLLPAFASQPLDLEEVLQGETTPEGGNGSPRDGEEASKPAQLLPRILELLHDAFLREAACAAIVALSREWWKTRADTSGGSRDTAAADAAQAAVQAAAAAAARAARICCPADSSLLPAAVTAAATSHSNRRALSAFAEETLGFLTVRYLLLHKDVAAGAAAARPAEAVFAALSPSAKAKAAQQLLQAIQTHVFSVASFVVLLGRRHVRGSLGAGLHWIFPEGCWEVPFGYQAFAPLCPRALMESNVKRFSSALLASAASASIAASPALAPKECAALVEVCDTLRPFTAADTGEFFFAAMIKRKAYGALKHTLDDAEQHSGFVVGQPQLLEVWAALKESRGTTAAAIDLKQRLGCLLALLQSFDRHRTAFPESVCLWVLDGVATEWEGLLQEVLPAAVPEVLLSLKDPNKKSREIAAAALEALVKLCEDKQLHLSALATFVAAGFGGLAPEIGGPQGDQGAPPPLLKSAAALALGRLLDLYGDELPHSQIQQWAKACIRAGDMDDLAAWLPSMLAALDNPNAAKARMKIRRLIEKLCKLMGEEALEKAMPEQHIPLLRYILRSERRRTIRRLIQQTLKGTADSADESEGSEEERGGGEESETDADSEDDVAVDEKVAPPRKAKARGEELRVESRGVEAVGIKSLLDAFEEESENERRSRRKRQSTGASSSGNLCIFEDGDGADASSAVLDFCGVSAAQQILVGMQPRKDRKTENAGRGAKRERKFSQVKVNEDGKIVIEDEEENDGQETQGKQAEMMVGLLELRPQRAPSGALLLAAPGLSSAASSPAAAKSNNPDRSPATTGKRVTLSCLAARRAALREMRKKQSGGHFVQRSGEEFKAKRAQGDLKLKAGMDPYAFVKLNRGVLKEKYRAQAVRVSQVAIRLAEQNAGAEPSPRGDGATMERGVMCPYGAEADSEGNEG
ncbi:hypothetical protein cyc_04214 [Cyclospora cayetanensis]|uniref:RRP12 HEAT domain-containing protein n=1 Tax=Cyclospora cayetanensis TaxID=88456 RepID=A0A1D3CY73_9EIME|nr:hypothetical protein cyc_04214 [Cyclospora cayetanensis]